MRRHQWILNICDIILSFYLQYGKKTDTIGSKMDVAKVGKGPLGVSGKIIFARTREAIVGSFKT
jgi:hypothetical protein